MLDASPVPIALNDEHGRITYLTPSFTRTFGYDLDDIPTLVAWWPKAYPDAEYRAWVSQEWARRLDQARRDGSPFEALEVLIRCKDGSRRTVIAGAAPLVGAYEGTHIVTLHDISEHKRAEAALAETERRHRKALKVGGMGYLEWDLQTHAISWSPETYRMFGYEPDEGFVPTVESTLAMVVPEERALMERELKAAIEGKIGYDFDHCLVRRDGRIIKVHAQTEVVCDANGRPLRMVGTVVDITERKAIEEALRAANQRLAEADRRKDEFLAVLSHELRNPLTPIRNSLDVLEHPAASCEHRQRAQAIIARQVNHLVRLVDDLVEVSRVTQGKIRLQRERVDLVDAVAMTLEDHRAVLRDRTVVAELPAAPIWIEADRTRLAQVCGNLLSNAAKFTPVDGRITIRLSREGGVALLEVADTGVGVEAHMLERIFETFAQADRSLDRSRGGLGLGLSLVKRITELHGGQVLAHSDGPGGGARFTIRLPVDDAARAGPAAPAGLGAGARRRVLIIEDNRDAAASFGDTLALAGHDVTVVHDGATGLAKVRELRPEVVLCDIGLPGGVDGYAVARGLRRDPAGATVFLVALTGYAQPEDRQLALDAGFDTHLAKPPDLDHLRRLVAEARVGRSFGG